MAKSRREEPKGRDRSGTAATIGVLILLLLAVLVVWSGHHIAPALPVRVSVSVSPFCWLSPAPPAPPA